VCSRYPASSNGRRRCRGAPRLAGVRPGGRRRDLEASTRAAQGRRVDAERKAFYRETFNTDVDDLTSFDLLINAGTTSLEAAIELVVDAFESKFAGPRSIAPKSGVRVTRGVELEPARKVENG
jgi:hypothetical protein